MSESSEAAPQIPIVPPTNEDTVVEDTITDAPPAKVQTPKRTPSKRKSFVERAQAESEQLLKSMGVDIEGNTPGRRTRSGGARSSPVVPAESPAKKAKTTPRGKAKGKKLLPAIADEKVDEEEQKPENSNESQKEGEEEVVPEKENHDHAEDKVDSTESTEVIPEPEVQNEKVAEAVIVAEEEKSEETPVEAMEVDSVPAIITTPPEEEVEPVVESAPVQDATEEVNEQAVEQINATQENELNTAEEIKQNEISTSSEETKVVTQNVEEGTNNHVSQPEAEVPVEQTENAGGHCQTETEPPAANSDIVQTPQSCN